MQRLLQLKNSNIVQPSTFQDWDDGKTENQNGWESGSAIRNSNNRFGVVYFIISNHNHLE